jgi:hypothetical protein
MYLHIPGSNMMRALALAMWGDTNGWDRKRKKKQAKGPGTEFWCVQHAVKGARDGSYILLPWKYFGVPWVR